MTWGLDRPSAAGKVYEFVFGKSSVGRATVSQSRLDERNDRVNGEEFALCVRWLWRVCLLCVVLAGCGPAEPELGDATEHFLAAQDALSKGDQQLALQELDASLAARPDAWAYYQRARLFSDMNQVEKAIADCQAGLQLDAEHVQLKWLQGELRKPADRRFQGRNKEPPVTK